MKSFTYRSKLDDVNVVLQRRKKKINKQQLIFNIVLLAIIASLAYYGITKIKYATFNGYVKTSLRVATLIDDAYITDIRVGVGDQVKEGDTLFTFLLANQILEQNNPTRQFTTLMGRNYDTRIHINLINKELELSKLELKEEMKVLDKLKYNAFLGIASNQQVESKNTRIKELQFNIKLKTEEKKLNEQFLKGTDKLTARSQNTIALPEEYTLTELLKLNDSKYQSECKHFIAKKDAIITDVNMFNAAYVYKKDPILSFQEEKYDDQNLYVETYVFPDDIQYVSVGAEVEILVTKELSFVGVIATIGTKALVLPDHLMNKFSQQVEAVDVRVNFKEGQNIPFWVATTDLPVKVRIKRI